MAFGDVARRRARALWTRVREGMVGCLFDEIQNLVEPTERLHTDVPAGPQRGRVSAWVSRITANSSIKNDNPGPIEGYRRHGCSPSRYGARAIGHQND